MAAGFGQVYCSIRDISTVRRPRSCGRLAEIGAEAKRARTRFPIGGSISYSARKRSHQGAQGGREVYLM